MNSPRILVVEDETIVSRDICQQLSELGYDPVAQTRTGEDAILQAEKLRPDLVLMDIHLAGPIDGIAAAQAIRDRFALPVVFLTAFASVETLNRAKLAQPFGYIVKPFEERELHTVLEMALYKHKAESALRESERLRSLLLDSITEGLFGVDQQGTCTFVNRAALKMLGYEREGDLLGKKIGPLIHHSLPDGTPCTPEKCRMCQALLTGEEAHADDEVFWRRDRTCFPVEYWFRPMRAGDCVVGAVITFFDIAETRRTQERIRLQTAALEAAANAIVITAADGKIEWANPAFTTYTGYSVPEALGHNPGVLLKSGKHDASLYRSLWSTILAGKVWQGEMVNRRKDGSFYDEDMTITPIRDTKGKIAHFIAVKQDISQRKILETQFRQAQKMEAVGQLAGGVAHDFNNILAAVMLHLGILQEEPSIDPNTRTALRDLEKEILRGVGLTRQLLAFSRQQAMEPHPLNANTLLSGLLKMLRRLLGEHIAISLCEQKNIPLIEADSGMLEQVIINLCVNARDAMPKGGQLTLRTEAIEISPSSVPAQCEARAGKFLRITVTDTGCGMDEKTLQRIFEPFFTTKSIGKGTGLGLATVYGIVKQHRGWIKVDSAVGQGTTFRIYLPAAETQPEPETQPAQTARPPQGSGETILLAEDEPSVRTVTGLTLRRNGYNVIEAADAPEAIRLWETHRNRINLLLTDMMMPGGMNGRELAEQLRTQRPDLRVIVCTGYSQALATENFPSDLKIGLLRKPSSPTQLLTAVRATLDQG